MRRVVITGFGVVSPVGNSARDTWSALMDCRSGIAPITYFDASTFPTRIAGEVKGFDFWKLWADHGSRYTLPRCISQSGKLAVQAAIEAASTWERARAKGWATWSSSAASCRTASTRGAS
jgi:3-oxoacyl-(acyl-carrier-protein) synthase